MTLEELLAREAIRHTMASYNMAGDSLREDAFAEVFTEDGVLESGVPPEPHFRCDGRPAIRAWIGAWRTRPAPAPDAPRPEFMRHHLATSLIEMTGAGTAKARTYWTVYTQIGPDHGGYYMDSFRLVGERWLIAHRRVRTEWLAEGSFFRR